VHLSRSHQSYNSEAVVGPAESKVADIGAASHALVLQLQYALTSPHQACRELLQQCFWVIEASLEAYGVMQASVELPTDH
jgi:hypothetical protein